MCNFRLYFAKFEYNPTSLPEKKKRKIKQPSKELKKTAHLFSVFRRPDALNTRALQQLVVRYMMNAPNCGKIMYLFLLNIVIGKPTK